MRDFRTIQTILGDIPADINKIYLLGSTGSGKTTFVQNIMGTSEDSFPSVSHRRTTVNTTEYVISNKLEYRTTILFKTKDEIINSIEDLVQAAISRGLVDNTELEDVIFELEQTPDERFKLKHLISKDSFNTKANFIINNIIPIIRESGLDKEMIFTCKEVVDKISNIINDFVDEIQELFNSKLKNNHDLFSEKPFIIEKIGDKKEFINRNKDFLSNDFGSITPLVEYVRIEGDLLSEKIDNKNELVLIDGEGIGHSFGEKKDTLSTRHHDYFNFCDYIFLLENAEDPFATGGQGAIEAIYLSGYKNKFKLIFSKLDKLDVSDTNSYFRRNLANLKNALNEQKIQFEISNKDTYKLKELNNKKKDNSKSISKILNDLNNKEEKECIPLEYDFNLFFSNLKTDNFIKLFKSRIRLEHWAVIKAFSKRMCNNDIEYRHIRPLAWILDFIMRDVNTFLHREDSLSSEISYSQNKIKQEFSKKILEFITKNFITDKNHLWKQAFEKSGIGSHKERLTFIFEQILKQLLPSRESIESFDVFRNKIKKLLIESGAIELKHANSIIISKVEIKKIYSENNFIWNMNKKINILIGKNGSGKSTIIKLIDACINNNKEVLEKFEYPYIELTVLKYYDEGKKKELIIKNDQESSDVKSILVSTFDSKEKEDFIKGSNLDFKLKTLIEEFGQYQRGLTKLFEKETEKERFKLNEIRKNIVNATPADLSKYQELSIKVDEVKNRIFKPISTFTKIINTYFKETNKRIVVEDEKSSLLVYLNEKVIEINQLSSGEKQLLIIFLSVILQGEAPFILLMDEPETSLHVEWQATIIDDLREINNNIQIIIATHNPLMALNRSNNEIGIIEIGNENVKKSNHDTKYLDVSSILLDYFGLNSLIGKDMQNDIKKFTKLKLREEDLTNEELSELNSLKVNLENSFAGDIIYNRAYFSFLKFLKNNKNIDFDKFENIPETEMQEFLKEFGGLFND